MNIARTSNGAVLPRASVAGAAAGRAENEGANRPSSLAARGRPTSLVGTANARGAKTGGRDGPAASSIGRKRTPSATASAGPAAKQLKRSNGDMAQEEENKSNTADDTMDMDTDAEDADAADKKPMSLEDIPPELKCSYSGQLMAAPIVMGDGNKYDLAVIDSLIEDAEIQNKQLKSPVTDHRMRKDSKNPCNATLAKIEQLIDSGAIEENLADDWRMRRNLAEAEAGDMSAAVKIGLGYMNGKPGYQKDLKEAFYWFRKAADKLDRKGLHYAALCYLQGQGVKKNVAAGIQLMTMAASLQKGYGKSVHYIGMSYYRGSNKLPKNLYLAEHYLSVVCQEKYDKNYECASNNLKKMAMVFIKEIRRKNSKQTKK